jgi:hypothetical protein
MPVPIDQVTHQASFDALAPVLGGAAGRDFVTGVNAHCVVHFRLVLRGLRELRSLPGARPGPTSGPADVFEDRIHAALTQAPGFALHRGAYVVQIDGGSEHGARAVWNLITTVGATDELEHGVRRANSWLAGDAVYVHFASADGGLGVTGAVVARDGDMLPTWQ